MAKPTREELIEQDVRELRRLGYAQQLFREMGGFANFSISFSIISILTGAVLLFGYGLKFAGPIVNSVGWPVVSVFTLCVAASMAELASAYPTAGGLYFWAFRLGGRGWAWATAWLNMIGQVTITAGINIGAAMYLVGAVTRIFGLDANAPLFWGLTLSSWGFYLAFMVVIMVPQVLLNIFGIRLTARLNEFSVYWHIGGVLVIALLLTIFGRHHSDLGFLFSSGQAVSPLQASSAPLREGATAVPALVFGAVKLPSPLFALVPGLTSLYQAAPFALVFPLALLQAQWTYTGYDASAHVAEETVMARKNSAWGVFLSVAVSAVVGYAMLLILTWCIPHRDVARTATDAYPVLQIVYGNLGAFGANLIAVLIGGAMWLCGASSITSMGRMWYAFARDDGMPGSRWLKRVSPRYRTPVWAIVVTSLLAVLITAYAAAYFVVTALSTITLYLAYVSPVYLNWRNRRRRRGEFATRETAPWTLGRLGPVVNLAAVVWVAFLTVVLSLPPNELTLWTMLACAALLALLWFARARRHFRGPAAAAPSPPGAAATPQAVGRPAVGTNGQ
ncbi:MAG: amino acid permease [Deltaproteobacteria bacterium]|nr:amino acid permease [Deltaproteobacteria bacterium]